MRALAFLVLMPLGIAGCLTDDAPPAADPPAPLGLTTSLFQSMPNITYDIGATVDWWEHIATQYPKHDSNTPTNAALREHLIDELQGIGMEVEVRSYATKIQGQQLPDIDDPMLQYHAIVGIKPGVTNPDHWIGLVSHYDSQAGTIYAAYDDASGVAASFQICKSFMAIELNKTLACIFFDAEERGLVASDEYVKDTIIDGDEDFVFDFVLGYDMTGINFPGHDWKMYVMTGENVVEWLKPFAEDIMHREMLYPMDGVEVLDVHDRNSDERRFKEAGIPILRFAGGRRAADYPQYHMPQDTVEYVYEFVGGRPNFEAGLATIIDASLTTVWAMDKVSENSVRAEYGAYEN